jgi:hypothetical protein
MSGFLCYDDIRPTQTRQVAGIPQGIGGVSGGKCDGVLSNNNKGIGRNHDRSYPFYKNQRKRD